MEQRISKAKSEQSYSDVESTKRSSSSHHVGITVVLVVSAIVIGILILVGLTPRLLQRASLSNHTKKEMAEAPFVGTTKAKAGQPIQQFTLPGSTQAIQDAPIYARVDGYLYKRYVQIGSRVKAGQLIAEISTPEVDQQVAGAASAVQQASAALDNAREAYKSGKADAINAAANVRRAKTDLEYYSAELQRYKKLVAAGAVSQEATDTRLQAYNGGVATLEAAMATQKSSEANVNQLRAAIHVAQAALDAAKATHGQQVATQSFKKVLAPFDGVITVRNVDPGALITSGSNTSNTLLFEIAETDVIRVYVFLPEQYVPYIRDREEAKLEFQEFPGQIFIGAVTNVSGGINPTTKTLQIEIHVPNKDGKLLPGMYAKVHFECPVKLQMPVIPATCVQTRPDGDYIFTLDAGNIAHIHKITVGRDLGGSIEVSSGVQAGEVVIVSPGDVIQDGKKVQPVDAADAALPTMRDITDENNKEADERPDVNPPTGNDKPDEQQ